MGCTLQLTQLKNKLAEAVKKSNVDFTVLQRSLSGYMNAYKDVYHMHATHESDKEICQLMALHAWNHVFKTRDRILKNTAKLAADPETAGECRDQGFTRPKILILAPFRQHALDIINALIQFSGTETQENDKRFFTEFDQPEQEPDERKPQDFNDTFRGNIDDCFRIGLKYNRKQLKMFSSFFSSDIIIASPLGLQMILGKKDKEKDDDFLSSIEVVFMYHAEVFMMQNWQHVKVIKY